MSSVDGTEGRQERVATEALLTPSWVSRTLRSGGSRMSLCSRCRTDTGRRLWLLAITLPTRPAMSINQYTLCVGWAKWTGKVDFSQEVKQRNKSNGRQVRVYRYSNSRKKQGNEGVRVNTSGSVSESVVKQICRHSLAAREKG